MDRSYRDRGILAHVPLAIVPRSAEPPLDFLRASVAGWDLDRLLRTLATISGRMVDAFDRGLTTPEFYVTLAEELNGGKQLPDEIRNALLRGSASAPTDPNQIANLALFAIANRNWQGIARPASLLMMLGVLNLCVFGDPITHDFYVKPESVEGAIGVSTTWVERTVNIWYRYLRFYRWSRENASGAGVDVPASIERGTGLSFEDYARCVVSLLEYYDSRSEHANIVPFLEASQITETGAPLHAWLDQKAMTVDDIDAILSDDPIVGLRSRTYHAILSKPIARIDDRYYLLNPRSLDNALGLGVFFAALDAGNKAQDFFAYAGLFFEPYVGELLKGICAKSGAYYHPEVADVDGDMSIDHFVLEAESLVFVEARFGKINRQIVESLSASKLNAALEELLYSKVKQLDTSVKKFVAGRLVVPGVDRSAVRRVYPVLALPHPIPRSPEIQAIIDAELAKRDWLPPRIADVSVAPLEIIEAEALEGLEGLDQAVRLSELIERKVSDPRSRFTFFKNHLILRENFTLQMSPVRQEEGREFQHRMAADSRDWIARR